MSMMLAKTPLHDWHVAHHGRMVDFAGWSMPVQYESIVAEHVATRTRATLFDISHMGRFRFDGRDAGGFLDRLVTRRVANLAAGQIRYGLITNEQGGILDDVLVYKLVDRSGTTSHLMVVNAGNRDKIAAWVRAHQEPGQDVTFEDQTRATAMLAVQGPRAIGIVAPLLDVVLPEMKYYTGRHCRIGDCEALVSRTGYTGEDGCELIVAAEDAARVWGTILATGAEEKIVPAGLGARNTLRLEAAMPLYGHELSESIDPYQAGLSFAVNLKNHDFVGREALARSREHGAGPRRIGLAFDGKRVPREHCRVFRGAQQVGEITSGTFSPTLARPIAMAYVQPDAANNGTVLEVDIRGRREQASVTELPFYTRGGG